MVAANGVELEPRRCRHVDGAHGRLGRRGAPGGAGAARPPRPGRVRAGLRRIRSQRHRLPRQRGARSARRREPRLPPRPCHARRVRRRPVPGPHRTTRRSRQARGVRDSQPLPGPCRHRRRGPIASTSCSAMSSEAGCRHEIPTGSKRCTPRPRAGTSSTTTSLARYAMPSTEPTPTVPSPLSATMPPAGISVAAPGSARGSPSSASEVLSARSDQVLDYIVALLLAGWIDEAGRWLAYLDTLPPADPSPRFVARHAHGEVRIGSATAGRSVRAVTHAEDAVRRSAFGEDPFVDCGPDPPHPRCTTTWIGRPTLGPPIATRSTGGHPTR